MHILPFWYTLLYYMAWVFGTALAIIFVIYLLAKLLRYFNSRPKPAFASETAKSRSFSSLELKRNLKIIYEESVSTSRFREGCHSMSAVLKTYFEILLSLDIEEMTAMEIKIHVKEKKELGDYFTELTVSQYQHVEPSKEDFDKHYNRALELIRS